MLYRHTGNEAAWYRLDASGYLELLTRTDTEGIRRIVEDVVGLTSPRADAPTKYVFDTRLSDFLRWLRHDGWEIRAGTLERLGPASRRRLTSAMTSLAS